MCNRKSGSLVGTVLVQSINHVVTTNLSSHFHWRYRWKYIDSWNWENGSPARNVLTAAMQSLNSSLFPEAIFSLQYTIISVLSISTASGAFAYKHIMLSYKYIGIVNNKTKIQRNLFRTKRFNIFNLL